MHDIAVARSHAQSRMARPQRSCRAAASPSDGSAATPCTIKRLPPSIVKRPGHGAYARSIRARRAAGACQSIAPSSFFKRRVTVAAASSCGSGTIRRQASVPPFRRTAARRSPPISSVSVAVVASGGMATRCLREYRAGIEPHIHEHDRHARLRLAIQDRRVDRRRAAIGREQRGMDIECAAIGNRSTSGRRIFPYAATTKSDGGRTISRVHHLRRRAGDPA